MATPYRRQTSRPVFKPPWLTRFVSKLLAAIDDFKVSQVCVCGGVAANAELRRQLTSRLPVPHAIPPIWLCTDNAAMIASAGFYRYAAGERSGWDLDVRPNLKLI